MILDTENINSGWQFNPATEIAATPHWATLPAPQLDHRLVQLEATVAAQARELSELRLALKSVVAALQRFDGDGR